MFGRGGDQGHLREHDVLAFARPHGLLDSGLACDRTQGLHLQQDFGTVGALIHDGVALVACCRELHGEVL